MSLALRMMELFSGMAGAHGTYILDDSEAIPGEKKKGEGVTKREPVTEVLWGKHLAGEYSLGVIPIKADNTCVWGVIDIDDYSIDIQNFAKRMHQFPVIPMRTKSGGCHIGFFLQQPVPARELRVKMAEISSSIGYGRAELFPKQNQVLVDKGDIGNWLNMPYFGGDKTTRYALDKEGKAMSITAFLDYAENNKLSLEELEALKVDLGTDALEDGPPCLQILVTQGFPEGTRNNGLFALGVYCRMAFPDNWEAKVEEYNAEFMDPPLGSTEVQAIIKQLKKKDYNYKCSDMPLCNYCNSSVCRTRLHGIGGSSLPTMSNLRKIPTDQPVWFLDVNDATLELNTDQLQNQKLFQKACMEINNKMPPRMSEKAWGNIIQALLDKCVELDKPPETGIGDQFIDLLYLFCADVNHATNSKEELLKGRAWIGPDPKKPGRVQVFFRLKDLEAHLFRIGFKYFNRSQIVSRLSGDKVQAKSHFFRIKGKGVNCWHIDVPEEQNESFSIPNMDEDVL